MHMYITTSNNYNTMQCCVVIVELLNFVACFRCVLVGIVLDQFVTKQYNIHCILLMAHLRMEYGELFHE